MLERLGLSNLLHLLSSASAESFKCVDFVQLFMDEFSVRAESVNFLGESLLVDELQYQAGESHSYPVIVDGHVYTFHDVYGGYDETFDAHVVELVQKRDGDRPSDTAISDSVEVHTSDAFTLSVDDHHSYMNNDDFILALLVDDYEQHEVSFRSEMQEEIGGRETRYE